MTKNNYELTFLNENSHHLTFNLNPTAWFSSRRFGIIHLRINFIWFWSSWKRLRDMRLSFIYKPNNLFFYIRLVKNGISSSIHLSMEQQTGRLINSFDFCQPITDVYCVQMTNELTNFVALNLPAFLWTFPCKYLPIISLHKIYCLKESVWISQWWFKIY